jgi:adenylate cyclase
VSMADAATVLIVDDDPCVLDSLEALLAQDYRVLRAERGEDALQILAAEPVAVIVSDNRMPGMPGTELLARSLTVAADTARILLTAFTDADALMQSINAAHIYHFVLKPWDHKELTHTVRRGVERYRLARERNVLLRDLAAKNHDLEATLTDLRAAQERTMREASVRAELQRYVSPRLVDMAVQNPTRRDLTGDRREVTVLFADVRGFTRLVESAPPTVVIRLLDEYFGAMIDVIFRQQGTVEQLVGDEIVALFGVVEAGQHPAARAVRTALDMVDTVETLAVRWRGESLPTFGIGVGISSGPVWAATIGSDRRRELIVVGRPMIAAARIQRLTRLFDAHIIAAERSFRHVSELVRYRELGTPRLKGLKDRQTLYEILALRDGATVGAR